MIVLAAVDACDAPPIGAKIWADPKSIVPNGLVHRMLSSRRGDLIFSAVLAARWETRWAYTFRPHLKWR